jgi:hypothetical protein
MPRWPARPRRSPLRPPARSPRPGRNALRGVAWRSRWRHSWFLDPAIAWDVRKGRNRNDTPLLVNTVGSWERRPRAATAIPNLFLSGDYVQTDIDLATMEGANESGRAAVNALLAASGSNAGRVRMFTLSDPPEYGPAKAADAQVYRAGLPNVLDRPSP